jgi:hypothetical protein
MPGGSAAAVPGAVPAPDHAPPGSPAGRWWRSIATQPCREFRRQPTHFAALGDQSAARSRGAISENVSAADVTVSASEEGS